MHIPSSEVSLCDVGRADDGPPLATPGWALFAQLYHVTFDVRPTNYGSSHPHFILFIFLLV